MRVILDIDGFRKELDIPKPGCSIEIAIPPPFIKLYEYTNINRIRLFLTEYEGTTPVYKL